MQPSVYLTSPLVNPAGTRVAMTIEDMYTINPMWNDRWSMEYLIGLPSSVPSRTFTFYNRTVNANLRIRVSLPTYVHSTWMGGLVAPQTVQSIVLSFNEVDAKIKSQTTIHEYSDVLELHVEPVGLDGPVFVSI